MCEVGIIFIYREYVFYLSVFVVFFYKYIKSLKVLFQYSVYFDLMFLNDEFDCKKRKEDLVWYHVSFNNCTNIWRCPIKESSENNRPLCLECFVYRWNLQWELFEKSCFFSMIFSFLYVYIKQTVIILRMFSVSNPNSSIIAI